MVCRWLYVGDVLPKAEHGNAMYVYLGGTLIRTAWPRLWAGPKDVPRPPQPHPKDRGKSTMSRLVIRQVDAPAHALRFSSLLYTSYISYLLLLIHFIHFIVPHISLSVLLSTSSTSSRNHGLST